jgi:hypothetical protein
MPAKPTELRKLIALLDSEAPDVDSLAKDVFLLVETLLQERQRYVIFAVHPSLFGLVQAVGPYDTQEKAKKDYVKRICAYDNQSYARIALLRYPDSIISD